MLSLFLIFIHHYVYSLESVCKFRAEIARKTTRNIFEQISSQQKGGPIKKTEYPQAYLTLKKSRRLRKNRHKTLPVTAEELSAIPEGQVNTMSRLRAKKEINGTKDSKADSGILSGSDDNLDSDSLRTLSGEFDVSQEDPARMSVTAKATLFAKQIEEKERMKAERKQPASGAKRYIDRKKRERSRTQPVTEEECKTAAEIADAEEQEAKEKEAQETQESSTKDITKETPPVASKPPLNKRTASVDDADLEEAVVQGEKDELSRFVYTQRIMAKPHPHTPSHYLFVYTCTNITWTLYMYLQFIVG